MAEFVDDIENIFTEDSPKKIKAEAELLREQNIKEREAFFASLLKDPEFAEAVEAINSSYKENSSIRSSVSKVKPKRYTKSRDETVKFFCRIPSEQRKSSRLRNIAPAYSEYDLADETDYRQHKSFKKHSNSSDFEDIDEVVFAPKNKRRSSKKHGPQVIISVEDVTEQMINNVVMRVSDKVYADSGTSCHQCRQKTTDQKTCCRSEQCFGVRGQFCGVCLQNRYGEDAVKALKDPNWHCPVCRGICNCSFCRAKEGKRPTGILIPLAQKYGHKSVKDFLDSLKGEGDYADESKDPKKLLGFSEDLKVAQMGGGVKYKFDILCGTEKLIDHIRQLERKLHLEPKQPLLLRGFENNYAKFDYGESQLSCKVCDYQQESHPL